MCIRDSCIPHTPTLLRYAHVVDKNRKGVHLALNTHNLGALISLTEHGERVLLTDCRDAASPRQWTGREIEAQANAVANGLLARGLKRGDRVALLAENRAEYITAYFGIMRAGLVAVPVNHKFPSSTIAFVLQDAEIRFAFTDTERASLVPGELPCLLYTSPSPRDQRGSRMPSSA